MSGDRIYINECRRSKYANLVSDTIIFFCTRCHWSRHRRRCADVFVQKPTRIICLSLSEHGKLWADGAICSVCARNARRSLFSMAFFLYDGRKKGGAGGYTSAKESLFQAPRPQNVHLITRGEEKIIREPK